MCKSTKKISLRIPPYEKSLEFLYPEIAKDWFFEKNREITPKDVFSKSNKIYWWKCKKGCFYDMQIDIRTIQGCGCPYCAKKRIGFGNDFGSKHPELLKEWDYDKNIDLSPSDFFPSSPIKVFWKCKKGCSYKSTIDNKVHGKTNCPYCSGNRVNEYNNLLHNKPHLGKTWNYLKNKKSPSMYSIGSKYLASWICSKCGDEFNREVKSINEKCKCRKCSYSDSGKRNRDSYSKVINDFKLVHGDKYIYEKIKYELSSKKVEIVCRKHGSFFQTPNNHVGGAGCPRCKETFGERKIKNTLKLLGVQYKEQKTFKGLVGDSSRLRIDFFITHLEGVELNQKIIIEYNGEQHYRPIDFFGGQKQFDKQQRYDQKKRDFAKDKGFKMIEIRYTEFKNIESILKKELT